MGFFDRIRDTFRDKTRDNIYTRLRSIGVDAKLAERGWTEGQIREGFPGLITIREGPIRWINVREETSPDWEGASTYFTEYGVPDHRLGHNSPNLTIQSVRSKAFPLVGPVVDLHWKGEDSGLGLTERLNNDILIKKPVMDSRDVEIRSDPDNGCWIISTQTHRAPSAKLWYCYQAIARHLLAEWP